MAKIQPLSLSTNPKIAVTNVNGIVAINGKSNKYPYEIYIQICAALLTIIFAAFIVTVLILNVWEVFEGKFNKEFYQSCDKDGFMTAEELMKLQKIIDKKDKELFELNSPYLPFLDDKEIVEYLTVKIQNKTNALNELYEQCQSQLSLRQPCFNKTLKNFFQKWHNIYDYVLKSYIITSAIVQIILTALIWTAKTDNLTKQQQIRLSICKRASQVFAIVHLIFWSILIIIHLHNVTEFMRNPPLLCGKWGFCIFDCDGIYRRAIQSCYNDHLFGCKSFYNFSFLLTLLAMIFSIIYIMVFLAGFFNNCFQKR